MDELNYTIAEASERLGGISYRTLHYYEFKVGLMINRDGSGNRIYSETDIEKFEKILDFKKKGMTLDGIKALFQEKGIVPPEEKSNLVVVDENALEMKNFMLTEIKAAISEQIKDELSYTNHKLETLTTENIELKDELRKLQRQNIEHYNMIDQKLSSWRDSQTKSWYKKIFKKNMINKKGGL